MKYSIFLTYMHKSYKQLIKDVRKQIRFKGYNNYYELHHVVPLNDGGKDEETNLILLTVYEHCEAHYLYAIERKNKDNHAYQANLNSAWIILYGKTFPPEDKENIIKDFLENTDEVFLTKLIESKKKKSEKFKRNIFKRDTLHTWVTNGVSNKKISNSELDNYFKEGWRKGYTKKTRKKTSSKKD